MIPAYGSMAEISPVFLMLLGVGALLTLYFVYSTFKRLRHARWVEDTPTSRIRSAAQGLVELKGSVQAGGHDPLLSPLAGTSCLWYRFTVEERRSNGKNERWVRVEHGSSPSVPLCCGTTPVNAGSTRLALRFIRVRAGGGKGAVAGR